MEDDELSKVGRSNGKLNEEIDEELDVLPNLNLTLDKDLVLSLDREEIELSDNRPALIRAKPTAKKKKISTSSLPINLGAIRRDLDLNLPPINIIRDILSDITSKAVDAGLDNVVK